MIDLTDERIYDLACDYDECKTYSDIIGFARALLALAAPQVARAEPAGGRKSLSASVADALRPFLQPGQKVIWRQPFRWFDDGGVMSNHYDGMSLQSLAAEFGYEVIHDCECAGIIAIDAARASLAASQQQEKSHE